MAGEKGGGKIWGICPLCGPTELVSRLRNIHLLGQTGMVMGIAVTTCKQCRQVVHVPDESLESVKTAYAQLTPPDIRG
ncbi:hypothetical protein [Vibrio sp. MEBiC08052]|uniref:hypothetical protein n=1 Tax=Vibrio sp. MEBiC08052 TaxID=1761910 RepID=UPI00074058DF|nr:hypothetical protein [Vibrio sp. MEBiC08052]KUI96849.1 hypothetical protein VRK_40300 [Vibrio sp. MEBiC08052]